MLTVKRQICNNIIRCNNVSWYKMLGDFCNIMYVATLLGVQVPTENSIET